MLSCTLVCLIRIEILLPWNLVFTTSSIFQRSTASVQEALCSAPGWGRRRRLGLVERSSLCVLLPLQLSEIKRKKGKKRHRTAEIRGRAQLLFDLPLCCRQRRSKKRGITESTWDVHACKTLSHGMPRARVSGICLPDGHHLFCSRSYGSQTRRQDLVSLSCRFAAAFPPANLPAHQPAPRVDTTLAARLQWN